MEQIILTQNGVTFHVHVDQEYQRSALATKLSYEPLSYRLEVDSTATIGEVLNFVEFLSKNNRVHVDSK